MELAAEADLPEEEVLVVLAEDLPEAEAPAGDGNADFNIKQEFF